MKLQIGDNLFHYVPFNGVLKYTVTGIRNYEDTAHYELECESCSHGYKCKVLVAEDNDWGKDRFKYIEMLNDGEREYFIFHNDGYYYPTNTEALLEKTREVWQEKKNRKKDLEHRLEKATIDLEETEAYFKSLEKELSRGGMK